jgi:hypothetical protein
VVLAEKNGLKSKLMSMGGIAAAGDSTAAAFLRHAAADPANRIGREIPHDELVQYAPQLGAMAAAFEPAEHVMFGSSNKADYFTSPSEKGNHGFWPTRRDYRSVFLVWGPGVTRREEPEMQMLSVAQRLAALMGFEFPDSK